MVFFSQSTSKLNFLESCSSLEYGELLKDPFRCGPKDKTINEVYFPVFLMYYVKLASNISDNNIL